MPHPRQHVVDIAEICRRRGVARVVISPGSRNAPLVDAFYRSFGDDCVGLVDERSAAFFALGLASRFGRPVVLLCSSGSALLNYAPALVEARYQRIPLIAVTADRPASWIDQQDNQTIRQDGVYANYVRADYTLPAAMVSDDDLWFAQRVMNEAINTSLGPPPGPVHVNVPLEEPLYVPLPPPSERLRLMESDPGPRGRELSSDLVRAWTGAKSVLVVHGQDSAPSPSTRALGRLALDRRVAVVAENIANVDAPGVIHNPELLLARAGRARPAPPELIVNSGGQVVSKKLKAFLRGASIEAGWRVGLDEGIVDTYQQATRVFSCPPEALYEALAEIPIPPSSSDYGDVWRRAEAKARAERDALLEGLPFSDLKAIGRLMGALPAGAVLELGNSAVIRYAQFFDPKAGVECHGNRGVSGIDGSLSTAAGSAAASGRLTLCILGDLSFLYDSNGLWNKALPKGLRIAVVNNGGGGIFALIGAPLREMAHRDFIEAHHPVDIGALAGAYGLRHYSCGDMAGLDEALPGFLDPEGGAALLEIRTNAEVNPAVYREILGDR